MNDILPFPFRPFVGICPITLREPGDCTYVGFRLACARFRQCVLARTGVKLDSPCQPQTERFAEPQPAKELPHNQEKTTMPSPKKKAGTMPAANAVSAASSFEVKELQEAIAKLQADIIEYADLVKQYKAREQARTSQPDNLLRAEIHTLKTELNEAAKREAVLAAENKQLKEKAKELNQAFKDGYSCRVAGFAVRLNDLGLKLAMAGKFPGITVESKAA